MIDYAWNLKIKRTTIWKEVTEILKDFGQLFFQAFKRSLLIEEHLKQKTKD